MLNINDALNVLGLNLSSTLEEVKKAYRRSAIKYHPDRNPAGLEMMKLVNVAYDTLTDYFEKNPEAEEVKFYGEEVDNYDYGEEINKALNIVLNLAGLEVELCGSWVWVGGETKEHKETLKGAGFKWARKKLKWYFRPEASKSRKRTNKTFSMDEIRSNYGSKVFKGNGRKQLN